MESFLTTMNRIRRILTPESGQEIAEAAVVLPLTMMLLLGIYWFGRVYNIYGTITHAAREGARIATAPTCAMCGNVATTQDQVADKVADILKASKLDPAKVSAITPALCDCGTPNGDQVNVVGFLQVFINDTTGGAPGTFSATVLNVIGCGNNPGSTVVQAGSTSPIPVRLISQ